MRTEQEIRERLDLNIAEREKLNNNKGQKGNKGHMLPALSIEADILKWCLEIRE